MKENCIAVIPARGGSKRIPDKNVRTFCGRPMLSHPIERALQSGLFHSIVVNTDSPKIAEVAVSYGAAVPFLRSAELANDSCGLAAVLEDSFTRYRSAGYKFKYACCLFATAPLIEATDLQKGFETLLNANARVCVPVTSFTSSIFRAFERDPAGRVKMIWPENLRKNSQELPEAFHDAGAFYWLDVDRFLTNPRDFFDDAVPLFLPRARVQDIDTPEDWEVAEQLYKLKHRSASGE